MPKSLPSAARKTAIRNRFAQSGGAPAGVFAMLVVVLVAMVSASSSARNEGIVAQGPVRAAAIMFDSPRDNANKGNGQRPAASADREIEAVANAVARRYRISLEATRELVGTAYREGKVIGVDPLLIIAVMAVESRFNPIAQSDGGAIGLMQVIPRFHADKFDVALGKSMLDPRTNIQLGARVLKDYIRRGGTDAAGLQLYNGASADAGNAYASKVLGERLRLREAVRHGRDRTRA
jgi:soluble lytic murein transglycosylase-like protein